MWEAFLSIALFGSFVWWSIITAVLLIILFVYEVKENGYVAFGFVVAYLVVFYFWGNKDLGFLLDWKLLASYFGIGLLYSIIRTLILGSKKKTEIQEHINKDSWIKSKKDAIRYKEGQGRELRRELSGNVSRWWLMWPISLIVWTLSDLLSDFWNWLWKGFRKVFEAIFALGFGKDDDIIYEKEDVEDVE